MWLTQSRAILFVSRLLAMLEFNLQTSCNPALTFKITYLFRSCLSVGHKDIQWGSKKGQKVT